MNGPWEWSSEIILTIGFLFAQSLPQLDGLLGPLGPFGIKLLGGQAYVSRVEEALVHASQQFAHSFTPTHAACRIERKRVYSTGKVAPMVHRSLGDRAAVGRSGISHIFFNLNRG
jgi:hypothetical protein